MGSKQDIGDRMETVANRVEFVELLDEEGPLPPRDVVEALDHSRGTVTRALRELREADLVEKGSDGYAPTLAGVMAAREYRRYETASRAILDADDLVAPITRSHAPPVEVLVDASTILAELEVPVRALEAVADRVHRADVVRAYLPTLVNTHLLRGWHRAVVASAVETEAVFDPDLLTVLKGQYPHLLAEMAATDGFDASTAAGPPYAVFLTTEGERTEMALVVYEDETAVRGVLTNDSPAAVDWARAELDRLGGEATDVTPDLEALSAAVADGVAPVSHGDTATGPSPGAGDAGTTPGTGHSLPIDLEAEGLVRLSSEYFESHGQADPAVSWRTGFTLAEVEAGHAVDRHDAEGRNVTDRVLESLAEGTDLVVLGPPGSGKSTVCMAVACEWFDRGLGPVLYREGQGGDPLESAPLLEAYLRQTGDHALVVVEDAVREEANVVFEVMQALDRDRSVTFLLDSRPHEWREPETFDLDTRVDAYRRTAIEEVTVPPLDEDECQRFVDRFETLVDADLELSGADLFELVDEGTAGTGQDSLPSGDAIVAQHHIARRYDPGIETDAAMGTALEDAVGRTYEAVTAAENPLVGDLAVLVALLTAAGVPVAEEYCYAIADPDEFGDLEEAIAALEGRLLFEHRQPRAGGPTSYRTRHEAWANSFLAEFADRETDQRARETVAAAITRLLALADEPDRRSGIRQHLGGRTPYIHQIEADPGGWADELAERLFGVGRTDASLAPLFGDTEDGAIRLPAACSAWTRLQQAYWRGEMNMTYGDLARAEREFETLGELVGTLDLGSTTGMPETPGFGVDRDLADEDPATHEMRWEATSKIKLGSIALNRTDLEGAEGYQREALTLFREIGDPWGEALALKELGTAIYHQTEYDRAREYYERSLDLAVEHDARRIESACLNNLASIELQEGNLDKSREHYEESLEILQELGDRSREAYSYNNLGTVAREQGDYDRARMYHERSIEIFRDLGNRPMIATNFTNLGTAAKQRGDYDRAREYHEESLSLSGEQGDRLGEAYTLDYLGTVARRRGDYDRGRECHERSLTIKRDFDARNQEAYSLLKLGAVARRRDDHDRAREHVSEALEVFRDVEDRHGSAPALRHLGGIAREAGEYELAQKRLDESRDAFETVGDDEGIAAVRLEEGRLALAREEFATARERAEGARDTFEDLSRPHDVARSRHLLGRIAAAEGEGERDQAREHWRAALETFETVGAPQDALATLEQLVEAPRPDGDEMGVDELVQRARDLLAEAPESTVECHGGWVEAQIDEFEGV